MKTFINNNEVKMAMRIDNICTDYGENAFGKASVEMHGKKINNYAFIP